jgi:hypothetical protein
MSAPTCRFCRHVNPAGAKFCNECGSPLHLRPCPSCEAITDAAAQACHQCGASFNDDKTVALAIAAGSARLVASPHEAASAPSLQRSDTHTAAAGDTPRDPRHIPEFFADRLEGSAGPRAPFQPPAAARKEAPDAGLREPVAARGVAVGDGEEIIAQDAVAITQAASDRPAVVEEASAAFVDTDDDAHFVSAKASALAGERSKDAAGESWRMPTPDAGDRAVRKRSRSNALHPAAWLVVLAALAGGGYYAYDERARLWPGLDDLAATARSTIERALEKESASHSGAGQDPANRRPRDVAPPATTTDGAKAGAGGEARPAAAPANVKAETAASTNASGTDARTQTPPSVDTPATKPAGDAATAHRAAVSSRASAVPRAATAPVEPPTVERNALPPSPPKAAAKSATPKRPAKAKPAESADAPDVTKSADNAKPTAADALATRRLIERELGEFLPPDGRRTTRDAPAATD